MYLDFPGIALLMPLTTFNNLDSWQTFTNELKNLEIIKEQELPFVHIVILCIYYHFQGLNAVADIRLLPKKLGQRDRGEAKEYLTYR